MTASYTGELLINYDIFLVLDDQLWTSLLSVEYTDNTNSAPIGKCLEQSWAPDTEL